MGLDSSLLWGFFYLNTGGLRLKIFPALFEGLGCLSAFVYLSFVTHVIQPICCVPLNSNWIHSLHH